MTPSLHHFLSLVRDTLPPLPPKPFPFHYATCMPLPFAFVLLVILWLIFPFLLLRPALCLPSSFRHSFCLGSWRFISCSLPCFSFSSCSLSSCFCSCPPGSRPTFAQVCGSYIVFRYPVCCHAASTCDAASAACSYIFLVPEHPLSSRLVEGGGEGARVRGGRVSGLGQRFGRARGLARRQHHRNTERRPAATESLTTTTLVLQNLYQPQLSRQQPAARTQLMIASI